MSAKYQTRCNDMKKPERCADGSRSLNRVKKELANENLGDTAD
jgi:hypothetical protein